MKKWGFIILSVLALIIILGILSTRLLDRPSTQQVNLLFLTKTLNSEYHIAIASSVKEQSKKYGYDIDVAAPDSENDFQKQKEILESAFLSDNPLYNGLIIAPNHSEALIQVLNEIGKASIPYVVVDTAIHGDHVSISGNCGFIGTDNIMGGMLAADYIGQKIGNGNVVMIRGLSYHSTSQEREDGFLRQIIRYPNIRVTKYIDGRWDAFEARSSFKSYMSAAAQSIDAIFAFNDPMVISISELFKEKNKRPVLVGFNGDREAQEAVLSGEIDATIVQTPDLMGKFAVDRLHDCMIAFENRDIRTPVSLLKRVQTIMSVTRLEK